MRKAVVCLAVVLLAWGWQASPVGAQELTVRSAREVSGRDAETGLRFSARLRDGSLEVELERDGTRIRARLGIERRAFQIEGVRASGGGPATLAAGDLDALARLAGALDRRGTALEARFLRVLDLLRAWPGDLPLRLSLEDGVVSTPDGTWAAPEQEAIDDICSKMNQSHDGGYPIWGFWNDFADLGIVGPYPWDQGDCLGRCGAGCPGDGPPNNSIFVFSQDCFNHDCCARDLGLYDIDCNTIFPATVDDFLYGPSCQKDNVDVVLNDGDGPVDLWPGGPVEIRVSLLDVPAGQPVDYWLYAETPAGTYWLDLAAGWVLSPDPVPALQSNLVEIADYLVFQGQLPAGFPPGTTTITLSLDLLQDGLFLDELQFEDAVEAIVSAAD